MTRSIHVAINHLSTTYIPLSIQASHGYKKQLGRYAHTHTLTQTDKRITQAGGAGQSASRTRSELRECVRHRLEELLGTIRDAEPMHPTPTHTWSPERAGRPLAAQRVCGGAEAVDEVHHATQQRVIQIIGQIVGRAKSAADERTDTSQAVPPPSHCTALVCAL